MASAAFLATLLVSAQNVAAQGCPGDLNGDRNVSVGELVTAIGSALEGCPFPPEPRFVDNGNGTITDRTAGLMWEKKVADPAQAANPDDLHNVYIEYPVRGRCSVLVGRVCSFNEHCPEGEVCTFPDFAVMDERSWLEEINRSRFASHSDWRLPTIQELMSLYEYGGPGPCCFGGPRVDGVFNTPSCSDEQGCVDVTDPNCSCTRKSAYRSSTIEQEGADGKVFDFDNGDVRDRGEAHVRAVRSISD